MPVEYAAPPAQGFIRRTGSWREISCRKCKAWREVPDDWPHQVCIGCYDAERKKEDAKKALEDARIAEEVEKRLKERAVSEAPPAAPSAP